MTLGPEDYEERLFDIIAVLERGAVPYLLTGALARNIHGTSRTSRDLDIVIHPDHSDPETLRDLFETAGFEVEGPKEGRLGKRLELPGDPVPADLWLASDTSVHRREFENAVRRRYEDRELRVVHPEDFILRKLVNYYRVRGRESDLDDAYQVLLHAWDNVDGEALPERAALYRIEEQARELVELVRADLDALDASETPDDR